MTNKIILSSLAMDLKRAALGYHRGSLAMAMRFLDEALKRKEELDRNELKSYIRNILDKTEKPSQKNPQDLAEDLLMYSTRIQNYVLSL